MLRDFNEATKEDVSLEIKKLMADIDTELERFDGSAVELASQGMRALSSLSDASAQVLREANALLPDSAGVTHTAIDTTLGRLGEIAYSFRNAFVQMPNALATFLSLIIGAVVDLFPVAFALVAFTPQRGGRHTHSQRKRGRAGKVKN